MRQPEAICHIVQINDKTMIINEMEREKDILASCCPASRARCIRINFEKCLKTRKIQSSLNKS